MSIASKDELAAWRANPVSAAMLEWLRDRIATEQRAIPDFIVRNEVEKARVSAGALRGYEDVLNAMMEDPEDEKAPEVDDFRDPATRPSKKKEAA